MGCFNISQVKWGLKCSVLGCKRELDVVPASLVLEYVVWHLVFLSLQWFWLLWLKGKRCPFGLVEKAANCKGKPSVCHMELTFFFIFSDMKVSVLHLFSWDCIQDAAKRLDCPEVVCTTISYSYILKWALCNVYIFVYILPCRDIPIAVSLSVHGEYFSGCLQVQGQRGKGELLCSKPALRTGLVKCPSCVTGWGLNIGPINPVLKLFKQKA